MTVTRAEVLSALSGVIDSSTIIVGHSLACDFDALGLIHTRVIDTAALYPHKQGWPFKRSLKDLALEYLHKEVQLGDLGHSPIADALISFELALHFIMSSEQTRSSFLPAPWAASHDDRHTIFHHIHQAALLPSSMKEESDPEAVISIVHHSCKSYQFDMVM